MSSSGYVELAKRMINAFKHFQCFVFEREEFEPVKKLINDLGLNKHVVIRKADPRYDYIYIVIPNYIDIESECVNYVDKLLAEGKINHNMYKKNKEVLIRQCMNHKGLERIKEVINILEQYLSSEV